MTLQEMSEDYFQKLVGILKRGICHLIDAESSDPEENGRLAAALVSNLVASFMAIPEPRFHRDVNAALEAAGLGWRLVPLN
jgi:hypothetical protein